MHENEIIARITALYPEAVIDLSGEDCSFELYIISKQFEGMNTLQRQQSILSIFKNELASGKLHALSIKAMTPEQQSSQSGAGLVHITL